MEYASYLFLEQNRIQISQAQGEIFTSGRLAYLSTMNDFVAECLAAHNEKRANHGVGPLTLNKEQCCLAQKWADYLASRNKLSHSNHTIGGKRLGENLASKWTSIGADYTGKEVVEQWYSEKGAYTYGMNDRQAGTGHFTQVVWKKSVEVGIGKAFTPDGRVFVVANYAPAGNVMGYFQQNVLPAKNINQRKT